MAYSHIRVDILNEQFYQGLHSIGVVKRVVLLGSTSQRMTLELLMAGDQWWPRTSGSRFRYARAITYLLRHRFGNFVKGNKRNPHKNTGKIVCLGGKK